MIELNHVRIHNGNIIGTLDDIPADFDFTNSSTSGRNFVLDSNIKSFDMSKMDLSFCDIDEKENGTHERISHH